MIYRKLDDNGDYVFGANSNGFYKDIYAVQQAISTRLKLLKYEWWEDLNDGLPLWQDILANRDIDKAKQLIKERIEKTNKVKCVTIFNATWDSKQRQLDIYALVDTEYGPLEINEVMN